jgi:hypothetical protein
MLVGRCSWELSGRKLQRKMKKSQSLSGAPHRWIGFRSSAKKTLKKLALVGRSPRLACALEESLRGSFCNRPPLAKTLSPNQFLKIQGVAGKVLC